MILTSKVSMDLLRPSWSAAISAVQDDRYSRNLEIALFSDGVAWNIPEDVSVVIRYSKADGKGGEYDTLPDGTMAWDAEGNLLTVALAPQVLTVPGPVRLSAALIQEEKQLSTFFILIDVHPAVNADIAESEEYHYVTTFLPVPASAKEGQYVRVSSVDEKGRVTGVEAVDMEGNSFAPFETDETLSLRNGILSVNRAEEVEEDNTLPITSAAVHRTVGNIDVILKTI